MNDDKTETGTTDTGATNTTDTGSAPLLILSASVSCDLQDQVTFEIETSAEALGEGMVFTQETGNVEPQWSDEHRLYAVDAAPSLRYGIVLRSGADVGDWAVDDSTVFSCDDHFGNNVVSHAFRIYDGSNDLADCLVLGHDPQGLIDGTHDRVDDPVNPNELTMCRVGASTY